MGKWIFCFIFCAALIIFAVYNFRFLNPYKLYMVFGKKGAGKSTYMVKLAYRWHKKGWNIFSNTPLPNATLIDIEELGQFVPPPHSVLFVDEVGMIWDNRNYKHFRTDVRDYFKLQRHYKNVVYLFSQTFDIDIKLRTLTDNMYMVTSFVPAISLVRKIRRSLVLVQPDAESEGRIADSLEFVPIWMSILGAHSFEFINIGRWCKYFDSYLTSDSVSIWHQQTDAEEGNG